MITPRSRRGTIGSLLSALVLRILVFPIGLLRSIFGPPRATYQQLEPTEEQRPLTRRRISSALYMVAKLRLDTMHEGHLSALGPAEPRDRFRAALAGVRTAYGVLPIGRLRALLREPRPNATAESVQRYREICFMHKSRHLFPVPAHVTTEMRRFLFALGVLLLMLFLGGYLGGFDVHTEMHEHEHEHAAAAHAAELLAGLHDGLQQVQIHLEIPPFGLFTFILGHNFRTLLYRNKPTGL